MKNEDEEFKDVEERFEKEPPFDFFIEKTKKTILNTKIEIEKKVNKLIPKTKNYGRF